ncbi:MAG: hypothetical protein M1823_000447 [Watsoniomyces obsoletus]|nr:MAG: hypothetical protein M1823_000447 [Watsoniomyces obsoletus]
MTIKSEGSHMVQYDTHIGPPAELKRIYKKYQLAKGLQLEADEQMVDFQRGLTDSQYQEWRHCLRIFPSLLPRHTQLLLLSRLLHRDLSNPLHGTNVDLHHQVILPEAVVRQDKSLGKDTTNEEYLERSFFQHPPSSSISFPPKDPALHGPLPSSKFLTKKLRWITLGGQYDWTLKRYPAGDPPPFPEDIASLVEGLVPGMKAQAAIVNVFSPGDTLSLHRDISESCEKTLVSISLGCDALFMVGGGGEDPGRSDAGLDDGNGTGNDDFKGIILRLHSGDVLTMSGPARFAWHGVPQILPGTCPEWMQDWPAPFFGDHMKEGASEDTAPFEAWRGWMRNKRINLNVRQMSD